jgi:zinc protease
MAASASSNKRQQFDNFILPHQMKTFAILATALLLAGASASAQSDLPIRDTVLANGLHVIVVENHAVPIVTVELDVKNGSFTEPPDYAGLSHLYEHMFFKANKAIPSQEKYLQRLRQLGASWNGTTSQERVNYFITVGADSIRPAMQFMEDAVRSPLFLNEELVRERPVVTGELDRNEANPYYHLGVAVDTLLYTPAFYSRKSVIGFRDVILSTTPEKMRTIQNRYYVPNNTALILAGDVTPAQGFKLAVDVYGDWPRGADPFSTPAPDPPPLTKTQAAVVEKPVNGATLSFALLGPSVTKDPKATYAADVLSSILGHSTSRFQKKLVESGLAVNAGIGYYTLNHTGPISIFVQTTPEKLFAARDAVLEEISKMTDSNYVTQQELEDAQKELGINALYEREQATNWAHTIGFWWSVAGLDYYRNYVPNMQRITRADLAHYAKTYIAGKPFIIGAMVNGEDRKKLGLTPESLLPRAIVP